MSMGPLGFGVGGGGGSVSAPLTLASGTITASDPALVITQTWNSWAVTFTAFKIDVTPTAYSTSSLLFKAENATTTRYAGIDYDGNLIVTKPGVGYNVSDSFRLTLGHAGNYLWTQWGSFYFTINNSTLMRFRNAGIYYSITGSCAFAMGPAHATPGAARTIAAAEDRGGNSGNAVDLTLRGQNGGSGTSTGTGGNVNILGGYSLGTGDAGSVYIDGGEAQGSGAHGDVIIGATRGYLDINGIDAAAAQTATMTNGPTAGNPSEWMPVKFNGNVRYIPVWA